MCMSDVCLHTHTIVDRYAERCFAIAPLLTMPLSRTPVRLRVEHILACEKSGRIVLPAPLLSLGKCFSQVVRGL